MQRADFANEDRSQRIFCGRIINGVAPDTRRSAPAFIASTVPTISLSIRTYCCVRRSGRRVDAGRQEFCATARCRGGIAGIRSKVTDQGVYCRRPQTSGLLGARFKQLGGESPYCGLCGPFRKACGLRHARKCRVSRRCCGGLRRVGELKTLP